MFAFLRFVLAVVVLPFKSKCRLEAENAALRHQLIVLRRGMARLARLTNNDRWFFIRRECTDHVIALGEGHLRRVLQSYAHYYNELRTHRSLNKDAPIHRLAQTVGAIITQPILIGLHHQYSRI